MLQRSPTYIVSRPSQDAIAGWLRRHLPVRAAYSLARWYNVLFGLYLYNLSRRKPEAVKNWIVGQARKATGRRLRRHHPFYAALQSLGPAAVSRARRRLFPSHQDPARRTLSPTRSRLSPRPEFVCKSGRELPADIVVTATGLKLQLLGGIAVFVDGKPVKFSDTMNFKGVMFSDVPNLARRVRLHQRVVDAQVRSDLRLRGPAYQLYGPARLCDLHAARAILRSKQNR